MVKSCRTLAFSHTVRHVYYELETYSNKIDMDSSPCSFTASVVILLYANVVLVLSKSRACLQRISNKFYEFCISFSLDVNLF